jgi:hypothetical protein
MPQILYEMKIFLPLYILLFLVLALTGCSTEPPGGSPPGYDLGAPEKFVLDEELHEISGICFDGGRADTIYAIEDEDGEIFHFHVGDRRWPSVKFGKRGDYEDVTILDRGPGTDAAGPAGAERGAAMTSKQIVVLRSDGSLFTFPVGFIADANKDSVVAYEQLLPDGEYEGLFGDEDGSLVALCKKCSEDKDLEQATGYTIRPDEQGRLAVQGKFVVDVKGVPMSTATKKKLKFHPSGIARHPLTKEWYIISAVNKVLMIVDDQWKVKSSWQLNVNLFKQPEGICFDSKGTLYISNEGDEGDANILVFRYNQSTIYEKKKDRKNH